MADQTQQRPERSGVAKVPDGKARAAKGLGRRRLVIAGMTTPVVLTLGMQSAQAKKSGAGSKHSSLRR